MSGDVQSDGLVTADRKEYLREYRRRVRHERPESMERNRKRSRARQRALECLALLHADDFERLYGEQLTAEGVADTPGRVYFTRRTSS